MCIFTRSFKLTGQLSLALVGAPSLVDLLLRVGVGSASSLELPSLTTESRGLGATDGTGTSGLVAAGGVVGALSTGTLGVLVGAVVVSLGRG